MFGKSWREIHLTGRETCSISSLKHYQSLWFGVWKPLTTKEYVIAHSKEIMFLFFWGGGRKEVIECQGEDSQQFFFGSYLGSELWFHWDDGHWLDDSYWSNDLFWCKIPLLLGLQVVGNHIHHGQKRMPKQRRLRPVVGGQILGEVVRNRNSYCTFWCYLGDLPSFKSRHRHRHHRHPSFSSEIFHHLSFISIISHPPQFFWENSRSTLPFLFIFPCRCLGVGGPPHHPIRSRYKCASAWLKNLLKSRFWYTPEN